MYLDFKGRRYASKPPGDYFAYQPEGHWLLEPKLPINAIQKKFESLNLKHIQLLFADANDFWDTLERSDFNVAHAGIDPEALIKADDFRTQVKATSSGLDQRLLHYYSIKQYNHSAQEALHEVSIILGEVYALLSLENIQPGVKLSDQLYGPGRTVRNSASPVTVRIWSHVSSVVLRTISVLDYTTKYLHELYSSEIKAAIAKPKSADKTFVDMKSLKKLKGAWLLNGPGELSLLFSLRDEIVHNGVLEPWSRIYEVVEGPKVLERFLLMPDHDNGRFSRVGIRRRFYSQDRRLNEELPLILRNTLTGLSDCLDQALLTIADCWENSSSYFERYRDLHDHIEKALDQHTFFKFTSKP